MKLHVSYYERPAGVICVMWVGCSELFVDDALSPVFPEVDADFRRRLWAKLGPGATAAEPTWWYA